jgi:hypothetical protein
LAQNYIFPGTAIGNHLFILSASPPKVTISYYAFFTVLLLPKIAVLGFDYLFINKQRQVVV